MKIFKILFLGIVLVVFNLAYLAAANPPDTITVKAGTAKPGGTVTLTVAMKLHSASIGGFIISIGGLPADWDTTAGAWWAWQPIGEGLARNGLAGPNSSALVKLTAERTLNIAILCSQSFSNLLKFQEIPAISGDLMTFTFKIPANAKEETVTLNNVADTANVMIPFPVTGPTFYLNYTIEPVVIANIPDYDALQLVASQGGLSGKTVNMSVKVENKDVIGSGSFKVTYPSSTLSLKGVTAGTRSGGMTFTISSIALAAAGDSTATVSFSGGSISAGGLGDLCVLQFTAAQVSSGSSANVALSNVVLKDAAGTALAALQQPTTGTTGISFFYGDTLFIDVKSGAHQPGTVDETSGISVIQNGKLYLPVRIKNSVPLTVIRFYIIEEAGKEDILSFNAIEGSTRTSSFNATVADSGSFIQVIAYAGSLLSPVPAGDGVVCTVIYDMHTTGVQLPVDINLTVVCVEIYDNTGLSVGVEKVNGVATIDFRVPENNENVGPGATLPKAFALAQNHPNPFNPSTTVNYQIPDGVSAVSFTLNVFDIRGRLIKILASGIKGPGYYSAFWDGTDQNGQQVSSGIYFYRFTSAEYTQTRKMVLLK